jgi:PAS domain S-box-containing protein
MASLTNTLDLNLLQAANRASAALRDTDFSEAAVFEAYASQLTSLGLRCFILRATGTANQFHVQLLPLPIEEQPHQQENASGQNGRLLDLSHHPAISEAIVTGPDHPIYLPQEAAGDLLRALESSLPEVVTALSNMPAVVAGILSEKEIIGLLAVFGSELAASDAAGLGAFAAHLGTAHANAALFASLKETKEILGMLTTYVEEIFWMSAPGKGVTYASPAYERVWGRTVESLYADPSSFVEDIHPDDVGQIKELFGGLSESPYDLEVRIFRPEGEIRWVRIRGFPLKDQHGNTFMVGTAQDTTPQKAAEASQLKIQERLMVVSTILDALIAASDIDQAMKVVAAGLKQIAGCSDVTVEASGESTVDSAAIRNVSAGQPHVTPDLSAELSFPAEQKLFARGVRSRVNLPLRANNEIIGALVLAWTIPNGLEPELLPILQQIADAVALMLDKQRLYTGAQRRSEQLTTLQELTRSLRTATSVQSVLEIVLDSTMSMLDCSHVAIALPIDNYSRLHLTLAERAQDDVVELDLAMEDSICGYVFQTGQTYKTRGLKGGERTVLDTKTGLEHPTLSSVFVPVHSDNEVRGVIVVGTAAPHEYDEESLHLLNAVAEVVGNTMQRTNVLDNLERRVKERTEALEKANIKLKELDRLKTRFVTNISHELRTPVSNLSLYTDLLERGNPEKREQYMKVIREQLLRLQRLIEDVVNLSRLDGTFDLSTPVPIDLNHLVTQLVARYMSKLNNLDVSLNFIPYSGKAVVWANYEDLSQSVNNLISNAIQYTPMGTVDVVIGFDREQREYYVRVTDTGVGISSEDIPHIFDRFYRGDNAHEVSTPGTGLGLSLAKEAIQLFGGRITVTSELNHGSTFTMWLPGMPKLVESE